MIQQSNDDKKGIIVVMNYFSKKTKYIQLKLEREYSAGLLPLSQLREHGLGQVQIQARPDRNLNKYLESIDNAYVKGVENIG